MNIYVVELHYNVSREQREEANPAHSAYLKTLASEGKLLLAGPVTGKNVGLLIYELPDEGALNEVLTKEPYVRAGLVSRSTIKTWVPRKGYLADSLNASSSQCLVPAPAATLNTSQGADS